MSVDILVAGITIWAALFTASLWVPVGPDEAWFLRVVQRTNRGERLYRDVFYGASPLPVWIGLLAVRASRVQGVALRGVIAGYHTGLVLATRWILRELGAPEPVCVVGAGVALTLAGPAWRVANPYATLSFAGATVAVACWLTAGAANAGWFVAAGVATGVALASKHTVGFALLGALSAALLQDGAGLRSILAFLAGATATVILALAPVGLRGDLAPYVRRAFTNKTTYLATGTITPLQGLEQAFQAVRLAAGVDRLRALVRASGFASLPIGLTAILLGTLLAARSDVLVRKPGLAAAVLGVVAFSGLFPRTDDSHAQSVLPLAVLAGLAAAHGAALAGMVPQAAVWSIASLTAAWGLVALAAVLTSIVRLARQPDWCDRHRPYLLLLPVVGSPTVEDARVLGKAAGGPVFVLRPDASLWYLAGDFSNPTPYDYPYASVFGPHGQRETAESIERGEIHTVCWPGPIAGPLRPVQLETFVESRMDPFASTPAGPLYRLR